MGHAGLDGQEDALHVDREHLVPGLRGGGGDIAVPLDPGGGHQDVEAAELRCHPLDGLVHRPRIGDVRDGRDGPGPARVDLGDDLAGRGCVVGVHRDGGALLGQQFRHGLADAARRAGHERCPAVMLAHLWILAYKLE